MLFVNPPSGPKEGRFHPGLLSPDRRRRYNKRQKHGLLFAGVLLVIVLYSVFFRSDMVVRFGNYEFMSSSLSEMKGSSPLVAKDAQKSSFALRRETRTSDSQNPVIFDGWAPNARATKSPEMRKLAVKETLAEVPIIRNTEGEHTQNLQPRPEEERPHSKHWAERPNLKDDLDALSALLPDELSMRELLRPIDYGGAPRMRELGLRTRAYHKYLSAWEKLHLVEDARTGETYIRDDLIQYLRRTQQDGDHTGFGTSLTTTIQDYETFRSFLAKLARILFPFTSPYFADHMTLHAQIKNGGRGIVLTAGDGQAKFLLTTIYALRKIGCELPIEIMYLGDGDLGEDNRVELEALSGVTTRDISQMVDDEGWKLAGWAIKPFAMLMSSFREVIFIDADSFFFRDPAKLFEDPSYVETGALFFRDRTIMPESKRRWLLQILPKPVPKLAKESSWWKGTSGHHQESGVVVMDKWKHFVSMLLICRFNGSDRDARPGKTGVYEMMHGDKETFWIGFLLANDQSFAFHKGAVGIIGAIEPPKPTKPTPPSSSSSPSDDKPSTPPPAPEEGIAPSSNVTICSPQLLHLDVDNRPLWFNGWLLVSKYAEGSKRQFSRMESFLVEPRLTTSHAKADYWKLATDNMCCLTSTLEAKVDIDRDEMGLLQMMRDRAVEVGAMS